MPLAPTDVGRAKPTLSVKIRTRLRDQRLLVGFLLLSLGRVLLDVAAPQLKHFGRIAETMTDAAAVVLDLGIIVIAIGLFVTWPARGKQPREE